MNLAVRAATVVALTATTGAGCAREAQELHFDRALPGCTALLPVLAEAGMPRPEVTSAPSWSSAMLTCSLVASGGVRPPVISAASVKVYRPVWNSDEKDPVKRYGSIFLAKRNCAGTGSDDPVLPSSSLCVVTMGDHQISATVSSLTKQSAILVTLRWADPGASSDRLRVAAVAKADTVALALAGML